MCNEAMAIIGGNATDEEMHRAADIFVRVADAGYSQGFFGLAEMKLKGLGAPSDPEEAKELYRIASDLGNIAAKFRLGTMCQQTDPETAFKLFSECAQNSFVPAYGVLGDCYFHGIGTESDTAEAVEWYTRAAEASDGSAAFKLGCICRGEMGVPADKKLSDRMFLLAAKAGFPQAQFVVADLAYNGRIEGGKELAAEWYGRCADTVPEACFNLATMYYTGDGVRKDLGKAFGLFSSLAAKGDSDAMFQAGKMLMGGEGVAADPGKGIRYIADAAKAGNREAVAVIRSLLRRQNAQFVKIDGAEERRLFSVCSADKVPC